MDDEIALGILQSLIDIANEKKETNKLLEVINQNLTDIRGNM